jgi:hypothetical protein
MKNESLILPFHLDKTLKSLNLKLSDEEFKKLWRKFDMENVGGVRAKVFLRLLNYKPNEVDEITSNMDKLRTKSCIISGLNSRVSQAKSSQHSYILSNNIQDIECNTVRQTSSLKINEPAVTKVDNEIKIDVIRAPTVKIEETVKNETKIDEIYDFYNQKPESANRGTSFSETKVRYMVQRFKSSLNFKSKDNLITFLNNKVSC